MSPSLRLDRKSGTEHSRRRHAQPSAGQHRERPRVVVKKGRHPKLTRSEQRKLARLYTYTELSTEDICEVLRKLHGKTISVRCAQNNIQEVLQTSSLISVRPRNSKESKSRIRQTPRRRVTEGFRITRTHHGLSAAPALQPPLLQLAATDDSPWAVTDAEVPDPQHHQGPWSASTPQHGSVGLNWDAMESNVAFEGYNNDHRSPEIEAPVSVGADDIELRLTNTDADFSLHPGTAMATYEFGPDIEAGNLNLAVFPAQPMQQSTIIPNLRSEFLSLDQQSNDLFGSDGYNDARWSWVLHPSALDNDLVMSQDLAHWQDLDQVDTGPSARIIPQGDVHASNGTVKSSTLSLSLTTVAPTHNDNALPTINIVEASTEDEAIDEAHNERPGSLRTTSWAANLGSLKRRLSYSSSRMSDIMTVFTRFSLSSKVTRSSSRGSSNFGHGDHTSWTGLQEIDLNTLCTIKQPLGLPGQFMDYGANALTLSSRCDVCVFQLNDSLCVRCSQLAEFNQFIKDYRESERLHTQWTSLEVDLHDRFNNTGLHLAAAKGADYEVLTSLIIRGVPINAVNTAGQTFLHVMNPCTLLRKERDLPALLSYCLEAGFDSRKLDHQGVNVLQALLKYPMPYVTMNHMFAVMGPHLSLFASRDNLGRTWQSRVLFLAYEAVESDPMRSIALNEILLKYDGCLFSPHSLAFDGVPPAISDEDHILIDNLVTQALHEPLVEDLYGRNGLHCIVGASLRRQSGAGGGPVKDTPARRQRRKSLFLDLIGTGVDVNAYDKAGNTPLMTILHNAHISAEGSDKGGIEFYLTELVKRGACVNARNRAGQSALHMAISRGMISATRALIKLGANLHARQQDTKGVIKPALETAREMEQKTKLQKSLHIRIMTCVNIARNRGAIDNPTVFQEWDASPASQEKRNAIWTAPSKDLGQGSSYREHLHCSSGGNTVHGSEGGYF